MPGNNDVHKQCTLCPKPPRVHFGKYIENDKPLHRSEDALVVRDGHAVVQGLAWANPVCARGMNVTLDLSVTTRRRLAQAAAVGAITFVLGATAAQPVDAMPRRDAVSGANTAIGYCFNGGGSPDSYEYGGTIYVSCTYDDGSVSTVDFPYRR